MPHGPGGDGGPGNPGGPGGRPGLSGMNSPVVQGALWGRALHPPEGGGRQDPISPSDIAPRDYTETEKVIIAIAIIVFVIAAIVAICYAAIIG